MSLWILMYSKVIIGYLILIITFLCFTPYFTRLNTRIVNRIYQILIIILGFIYIKRFFHNGCTTVPLVDICSYCFSYNRCLKETSLVWKAAVEFFYFISQYTLSIFPSFIFGTLIAAGFYCLSSRKLPVNLGMSILLGISLPLCICGVFPIVKSMMLKREIKDTAIIAFLFITPMLSPFTIYFSYAILGKEYLIARLIATITVVITGSFVITRFLGFKEIRARMNRDFIPADMIKLPGYTRLLETGEFFFKSMLRYMLAGIVLGSIIITFLPLNYIERYIVNNPFGLFIITAIALPVNMCSGQEIVVLKSLSALGISLGHQIAFSIAATGICLTTLPLYIKFFTKRVTLVIIAYFLFSSVFIGYLVDYVLKLI